MPKELDSKNLIFKFQNCNNYLFNSLRNSTLYFNSIEKFNDPFEFSFSLESGETSEEGINHFYDEIFPVTALKNYSTQERVDISQQRKNSPARDALIIIDIQNTLRSVLTDFYGVVCFTKNYKNVLMWSHYSSIGKGIVQVFNSDELFTPNSDGYPKLLNVKYEEKAPKTRVKLDKSIFHFDADSIISTKQKNWQYEEEIRATLFMMRATPYVDSSRELINHEAGKLRNVKYNSSALRGIIFGHQCSTRNINRIKKELKQNPLVEYDNLVFYKIQISHIAGHFIFRKTD